MNNPHDIEYIIKCSKTMMTELQGREVSWGEAMFDLVVTGRDKEAILGGLEEARKDYRVSLRSIDSLERAVEIHDRVHLKGGLSRQVALLLKKYCREDGKVSFQQQAALEQHKRKFGWIPKLVPVKGLGEKIFCALMPKEKVTQ